MSPAGRGEEALASLRPRTLPKVRDQIVRHLADPGSRLRRTTAADSQGELDLVARHLSAAGLYWVAPDMAALAVAAGTSLETTRWATADRPSGCGLLVWGGGIGSLNAYRTRVPVEACAWGPAPGGCLVTLWISRARIAAGLAAVGATLVPDQVPPLVPAGSVVLPVTAEPAPLAELPAQAPGPTLTALAASWLLMQQPKLADRTIERPDRSVRRAYGRAGREDPHVTVVDLRRLYVPQDREQDEDTPARRYRHRWVVSGHWRNAWRPSVQEHRRVWIPAYVKGPDGAPLLAAERVNVWRR